MDLQDRELIDKAKTGDLESLEKLLEKYNDKIASIAKYVCVNAPADADDVHNETMISVFKNIDKFKSESDFSTWFYRIAANHCWMKFRKRKREKLVSIEDVKDLAHYEKDRNVEISHDFYKILAMLPLDFRMAVTLVDIEGFSLKDAAKELNITVGALKSRLFRARNMFKKKMEEEDKKGFE
ncbi:MAG: RNA polymerase sigma factor [Elusimicrobiales bacterium]